MTYQVKSAHWYWKARYGNRAFYTPYTQSWLKLYDAQTKFIMLEIEDTHWGSAFFWLWYTMTFFWAFPYYMPGLAEALPAWLPPHHRPTDYANEIVWKNHRSDVNRPLKEPDYPDFETLWGVKEVTIWVKKATSWTEEKYSLIKKMFSK